MTAEEEAERLVEEGKAALRDGRALLLSSSSAAAADRALAASCACFERAAALDPRSVRALGNWGNALSAVGAAAAARADAASDAAGAEAAEAAADAAWVAAGDKYRRVAELAPGEPRAMWNWARALACRAGLQRASSPSSSSPSASAAPSAERLLESAAAKLDAVLAAEPTDARAAREAGLVLERLAGWKQPGGKARRDALRDSLSYLAEAAALGAEDEGGEAEAAAARASAALAEAARQRERRR